MKFLQFLFEWFDFYRRFNLMLDYPFLFPSRCKLNHFRFCFIQISTKSPAESLFPSRKAMFFLSHPQRFGPLGKFQHSIKISFKTARVSRLSVSCDYGLMFFQVSFIFKLSIKKRFFWPYLRPTFKNSNFESKDEYSDPI